MDCHFDDDRPGMILTLDLASEKYREFPIPVHGDQDEISLCLLGSYLYICHHNFEVAGFQIDVWIMKKYGVTGSWRTPLCSVKKSGVPYMNFDSHIKPLVFSKNGHTVLFEIDCEQPFWFDLEKKSVKQVEFCRKPDEFEVIVCEGGGARGAFVLFSMVIL
ncbi:F-box protein CPR1-like [Pyrus communis]|uniref:F-box protein CPR1-like n=1 Tax=Pyrus communis TaxID=23211 RepID=UPI0035C093B7